MRRTLILTAVGATTLSIGIGLGATLASADPSRTSPTVPTTMMANGHDGQMHDGAGMAQMMGSTRMTSMDADDMNAMHTTMHATMSDNVSADQLAACDSAHAEMNSGESASVMPGSGSAHTAHHQGSKP